MQWETVIGLEIHAQLSTQSKIFSASAIAFGAEPNTQASLVDLGMPGTLPVLNAEAVRMACKFGLAIDAEIAPSNVFARKNYFYPDLPKGYQTSQMDHPIVGKGFLDITLEDGTQKRIGITRAHLEEDAGKSLHEDFHGMSGIDLNRAGTPLLEIVSEPDMRSSAEAAEYARALHDEDLDVDTDFCAMCGHDWCSVRISKEIVEWTSGKAEGMERAGEAGSSDWVLRHQEFHALIYNLSGRPKLIRQITALHVAIEPYMRIWFDYVDKPLSAREEHQKLIDALRSGDARHAEAVMQEHIIETASMLADYASPGRP